MAINRLAQSNPTADTDTLLHTSTRNAIVSIIATNTSSAADVTMWTVPSGAGSAGYVYHAYESPLPGNNTLETFRFAIEDGDELYVKSSTAFVSFSLNGIYESNGTSNITVASLSASPTENTLGDVWVNTDEDVVYFWDGSTWIATGAIGGVQTRWIYTATGGETTLSGTDDNGLTLSYTPGFEQIYLNGVLLIKDDDYTATTGTSITGLTGLAINDIIQIITLDVTTVDNTYTQAQVDALLASNEAGLNPFFLPGI